MRFLPAFLCMLPSLAVAGGVIWSDRFSTTKAIRIAGFDGTGARSLYSATVSDPRGVIVDTTGGRVFYLDRGGSGGLHSVTLAGDDFRTHISSLSSPADLRFDRSNRVLYWCEEGGGLIRKAAVLANPMSLTAEPLFSGLTNPYYLDIDRAGGKIYWGQNGPGIFSGPLNGGSPDSPALYNAGANNRGVCVEAAAGMLYWCERDGTHVVRRRPIGGGTIQNLYPGLDTPHGLVLDIPARKLYWADTGTNNVNGFNARGISRGDMDGSTPAEIIIPGTSTNQPWDVDLDTRTPNYGEWVARFFRLNAPPGETARTADPDGDDLNNFGEYAFGTPPRFGSTPIVEALTVIEAGTQYLALRFLRRLAAADVTYRVEYSTDLVTWRDNTQGTFTVELSAAPLDDGLELVTARSATSLTAAPAQFLRVQATQVIAGTVEMVVAENEPGDERERVPRRLKNKNRRAHSAR
jgi:hypothetical protein